ncbi:MAG: DNA/RNA helicase domain-containing protein [Pseudomonadota bacterium]
MLLTVREFVQRTSTQLPSLVSDLQEITGRYAEEEKKAWSESLARVAGVLSHADLGNFHVRLGRASGNLSLEYRLPAASTWCDLVLLGRGEEKPSAVMVELKNWNTRGDRPGPRPGILMHHNEQVLHPSEQVRGYVEYCRRFHSAVQDTGATVEGCTLLTGTKDAAAYTSPPHDGLAASFPVFTMSKTDVRSRLPLYLKEHLHKPDPNFAEDFEDGVYQQDRSFVRAVAEAILDPENAGFVLLDAQRLGFEKCLLAVEELLYSGADKKTIILVEGPPGSGKSVLAARLWAALVRENRIDGNIVFATTSGSQRSNWESIFESAGKSPAGRGIVIPTNRFNPGLSPKWVNEERRKGLELTVASWRENLALWKRTGHSSKIKNNSFAVTVVDEAHALIDPTAPGTEGVNPSGWCYHAGPQAWHIMRASRLSLFFLDPEQSYRDNETTTAKSLHAFAEDFGAHVLPPISLADAQYRCAGSKEYVDWVERLFSTVDSGKVAGKWRATSSRDGFVFETVADPVALEKKLRPHISNGRTARLLAAYGRPWKTKGITAPHSLPPSEMDFEIPYIRTGRESVWSRIWNYAPKMNYTLFVQAPPLSKMNEDPLSEVGCPYVVRGFDFDYVGLLWLSDLVWRKDRWVAQIPHIHESAWRKTLAGAKREKGKKGPANADLLRRLFRGYRILLTRPIRGIYVWFEDEETQVHVEAALGRA